MGWLVLQSYLLVWNKHELLEILDFGKTPIKTLI